MTKLRDFEGKTVLRSAIEIPNAAGGLRDALDIDPAELHHDDEGYVTLHYRVKKVRFDEIKDTDALSRVHVFDVDEAIFEDDDAVEARFAAQRERIAAAKAKAERDEERQRAEEAGEMRIPGADPAADLVDEHDQGGHAKGLVDGCALCDAERDAQEAGD